MKVTELDERVIQDIGHAFGYYDCGQEHGLIDAFPSRDAAADFICGYVRMALRGGILYATSERGEGYLAYKRPGERLSLRAMLPLAKGLLGSMTPKALFRFAKIMAKGEPGLDKRFDREKRPCLFVGQQGADDSVRPQQISPASATRTPGWRLFFLIVEHTMAVALEVGILDLIAELLAHTLVFLCAGKPARAVAAGALEALLDAGDYLLVLVQPYLHSASSSFLSASFSR